MSKKIGVFAGLLLVLAAVAFFIYSHAKPEAKEHNPLYFASALEFTKIELINPTGTMRFEQDSDGWKITSPIHDIADNLILERLINTFRTASFGSVITSKESNYTMFGLTPQQALHAKVFLKKTPNTPAFDGYVSAPTGGQETTYVRLEGNKDVYIANQFPLYSFSVPVDVFRPKRFFPTSETPPKKISVNSGKISFVLVKSSDVWKNEITQKNVDPAWAANLWNRLQMLMPYGFGVESSTAPETGFDRPVLTLGLVFPAGEHKVLFGNEKKNLSKAVMPTLYAKSEGRDAVMYVLKDAVGSLQEYIRTFPKNAL